MKAATAQKMKFSDGGSYHIETSSQWTGFYMIGTSVMKYLMISLVNR